MKIPYATFIAELPGAEDVRLFMRPIVPLRIGGPLGEVSCDALLDTGADECLFPRSVADALGIELDTNDTFQAVGITGEALNVNHAEVELHIEYGSESIHWKGIVGFAEFDSAPNEAIILGHQGCLDYFTAIFNGETCELELLPNALLPA